MTPTRISRITDTQMAWSGVNKRVLEKFGGKAVCFMSDPDVAAEAKARGETRATVSMERAARLAGTIPYELTCAVSKRVPRLYMENGKEIERSLRLL